MGLARALVAGCDVWLNNPIRPHEACGTSGMKAAMNGVLNVSVLDGWWDEAPYEETGFVIGPAAEDCRRPERGVALRRAREAGPAALLRKERCRGCRCGWIEKMVQSASRIAPLFSSDRMVIEYLESCYVPGAERRFSLLGRGGERLRAGDTSVSSPELSSCGFPLLSSQGFPLFCRS